jgi:mannosyltransferase
MRRTSLFLLVAILLLAAALRFHRLDAQSFWNDEGNSARLSERTIPLLLAGTASDVHPPFYYLLLRGWRELAGETEFSLRAPSAFAGVLLVAVVAGLTRALLRQLFVYPSGGSRGRRKYAQFPVLLASLLATLHPGLIYYSQEARMYQLLALLAALSTLLLWQWYRLRHERRVAVGYVVCVAAGLYTHYFFPAILVAHGFVAFFLALAPVRKRPRQATGPALHVPVKAGRPAFTTFLRLFLPWPAAVFAAVLLFLPWLPIFVERSGGSGREVMRGPFLEYLEASGRWLLLGPTDGGRPAAVLMLAVLLLVPLLWPAPRRQAAVIAGWLALLLVAVPLLLLFGGGLARPAYFKFLLIAVPPLCVALALGWQRGYGLDRPRPLFLTGLLLVLLLLWGYPRSLYNLYYDPAYARADYRGLAARIAAERHPDAAVILNAPNQWEVFTYYHQEGAPVYPMPRAHPDPAAIDAELSEIAAQYGRLYAIFWGEGERDPERLVERWLDSHTYKAIDEWVGEVRFVVYATPVEPAREMATAVVVTFGESIHLDGFTVAPDSARPGDIIQVALYWQTTAALDRRYKVFLHLLDESGALVGQRDSEPGGGLALTTTWRPGEIVVDQHGVLIPPDAPHGRYSLLLGLYDIGEPAARLPLTAGGPGDAFRLAYIQVGN